MFGPSTKREEVLITSLSEREVVQFLLISETECFCFMGLTKELFKLDFIDALLVPANRSP